MTYEELKAAYEAAVQKCSELEKENDGNRQIHRVLKKNGAGL